MIMSCELSELGESSKSIKPFDIVTFTGLHGAGKNTAAKLLKKHGYKSISFASCLKDIVATLFMWDRDVLEGLSFKDRAKRLETDEFWSKELNIPNFNMITALQQIGTDAIRNHFHNDVFAAHLKKRFISGEFGPKIAITDARFPNEIHIFKELGGRTIRLQRTVNQPLFEASLHAGISPKHIEGLPHTSEWKSIGHEDVILLNIGTKKQLYHKLCKELNLVSI